MSPAASFAVARALHVLAIVAWIGGVAFVTTVLLPGVRDAVPPEERFALFDRLERRFAAQARATTLLAGATGLWMLWSMNAWSWLLEPSRWYLHAMIGVWTVFTLMLFVLEPLVLHRRLHARAERDPEGTFRRVQRLHAVLLTISLITVFAAVAGAHGWPLWPG
jgi:uncharacterized membrane protein